MPSHFEQLLDGFRTPGAPPAPPPIQRSLDDLGRALVDTTFCVIDLETTGGSPTGDLITEIGAVRVRGGEVAGTFQTLVNPGRAIPPTITVLTGISDAMVVKAPRIEAVLGTLVDFVGDAVVVGHNVRFDVGFLRAALERDGRAPLSNPTVDTATLARKLLAGEMPDHKLGTLARRLRLPHRPNHRALDDALATADLLHVLLGRAASLGVTGLDDLLGLPSVAAHPLASKLALTDRLPRRPGVYLFRDGAGRVLYVGKATNLRARVRSYFSTDDRRKVPQLLRATERIDYKATEGLLEAEVLEVRLIHHLDPQYNARGTRWRSSAYLRLSLGPRARVSVVRTPRVPGRGEGDVLHLGPLPSSTSARRAVEAITTACPQWTPEVADLVAAAWTGRPDLLLEPLRERLTTLAAAERFEEAATLRDRMDALVGAIHRTRRFDRLRAATRLVLIDAEGRRIELHRGRLAVIDAGEGPRPVQALPTDPGPPEVGPLPAELADELACADSWLDRHADGWRLVEVEGEWASALPGLPRFRATVTPTRPPRP